MREERGTLMAKQNANAQVDNFTQFHTPMHASLGSRPVRCIAYGDVQGNSPSYLVIDENGQSTWVSIADLTITDTNFLPLSAQAHTTLSSSR